MADEPSEEMTAEEQHEWRMKRWAEETPEGMAEHDSLYSNPEAAEKYLAERDSDPSDDAESDSGGPEAKNEPKRPTIPVSDDPDSEEYTSPSGSEIADKLMAKLAENKTEEEIEELKDLIEERRGRRPFSDASEAPESDGGD